MLYRFSTMTAGAIGCFRNIIQPLIPAMLAKLVSDDEHGK